MTRILAIDTTAQFGSLALFSAPESVDELLLHAPEGFGHILYQQIDRILKRNQLTIGNIDVFAVASGPGSFTGVRIGLAAAKGLSEATGKPLIVASNLKALAILGSAPLRASILDARRGEIYGAVYDAELNLVQPEVVAPFNAWLRKLPDTQVEFIAQDFTPFRAALGRYTLGTHAGTGWTARTGRAGCQNRLR